MSGRHLTIVPPNLDDDCWDDASVAEQHLSLAQHMATLHRPEVRDAGTYCVHDRAVYPCRLSIWGRRVLTAAGWNDEDIAYLLAQQHGQPR